MRRSLTVPLLLLVTLSCGRQQEAPPPAATQTAPAAEQPFDDRNDVDVHNLLNIANGAAVVSRTAELDLERSAAHAIDGMHNTGWSAPANAPAQTLVYSFGAPSRVDKLGITTDGLQIVDAVRFEGSTDGTTWREVFVLHPRESRQPQVVPVPPFEASYLRVTTVEDEPGSTHLLSVHALGQETASPVRRSYDGCWTINSSPARLIQKGHRLTGVINGPPHPTHIDGTVEGRLARVMWMRGNMWGYAALTLTADGKGITAATFHANPRTGQAGQAWIGERCEGAPNLTPAPPEAYVGRARHWSIEDASAPDAARLIASRPQLRFRVTGYEYREATAEANRKRLDARFASLRAALEKAGADLDRIEFVAAENPLPETELHFAVQRVLWSRMDLQPVL